MLHATILKLALTVSLQVGLFRPEGRGMRFDSPR
jgi:hypothetical protein